MTDNYRWLTDLPEGWHMLYGALISRIEALRPEIVVGQAKQKFGELRVYVDRSSPEIRELIDAATTLSRTTCETCGAEGQLRDIDGFFATRCDEHSQGHGPARSNPIVATFRVVDGQLVPVKR